MKSGINKLFTIMHQQDLQGNPGQSQASLGNSELSQPTISEYFTLPDATLGHSTQLQDILRSLGNSGRPWATGANGCTVAPRSFSVIVFNQYIKEKHEIPTLSSHLLSNVGNYHCSCYGIGDVVLGSDLVVDPGTFWACGSGTAMHRGLQEKVGHMQEVHIVILAFCQKPSWAASGTALDTSWKWLELEKNSSSNSRL